MIRKRNSVFSLLITFLLVAGGITAVTHADPSVTYSVTNTNDSGPGSLRQAILDANANPGLDTLTFAIGATGSQQTIQPTSALPSLTSPVIVDGWSQGGGSYSGPPLIEIDGGISGFAAYALRITSGGSTVRGITINDYPSGTAIILLTNGGNWVYGNFLGVNMAGTTAVANNTGIFISADSSNNIIGTNGDGVNDGLEGNLISGNSDWGILITQAITQNNVVAGNKIGTDVAGETAVPNGTSSLSRCGIYMGGEGNRIGTDNNGISDSLERNLISGNHGCGISLNIQANPAAAANVIAGNYIGTNSTGLAALPNSGSGLASSSGPNYNVIIRNNVISGNDGGGITISGLNQAIITGNFIGVAADGTTPLGNGSLAYNGSVYGIYLAGNNNQIGGTVPGEGNVIANQTVGAAFRADGIALGSSGTGNSVRGNAIYANKNLGIDLNDDNIVNPNDDGDGDSGANNLQNYPALAFAQSYVNGETIITGTLNSQTNTPYDLDFFASVAANDTGYGEGETYLSTDQVTTDASGIVTFTITLPGVTVPAGQFVTATATDPAGNTSEFSQALGPVSGVQDLPISGLTAQVTPPIFVDIPTAFVATVNAGSNVAYAWDFGDGNGGSGAFVQHTFTTAGTYTATVNASNSSSSAITETIVTVLEPANINGVVWYDKDEDGFFGLGESAYLYPGGAVVTATLQNPLTVLSDVRDNQGNYQILTPQPGLYVVEAGRPFWHTTSPNPIAAALSSDGGVTINFGMNLNPTAGTGRINGRSWADTNANNIPDPGETPLSNLTITLRNSGGIVSANTTDATGWINLPSLVPGTYWVDVAAPPGYHPALQTRQVTVAAGQVINAHAPFLAGGTVSGQVSSQSGVGIGGVTLTLLPDNVQTTTTANGSYSFSGLSAGNRTLQLTPPTNHVTPDNINQRFVPVTLNSGAVENWALAQLGQVTVKASQVSNGQALPVGNMLYELLQNGTVVQFAAADVTGKALFTGLTPGTYSVRPLSAAILPGTLVIPAERTAVVTLNSAATLSFNFNLARSLSLYCRLPGTPPAGFACQYEIRNSGGSLIDSGSLPAASPAVTLWNLNPATLDVRLIPDPAVTGQESWPSHSQIVVLDDSTHANVYYPFNPTNPQTISGYAFWDRCAPLGSRGNVGTCNETGVGSNNGLTVTLKTAVGATITSTQTVNGTGYSSGYFAFPNVPVGSYRVVIDLPTGYAPTTAVDYGLALDGISAVEATFFGYQINQNRLLSGQVYTDMNNNGQYDADWDDPLAGVVVTISTPAGQTVATRTTASDGSFTVDPIASGDYRATLQYGGESWVRITAVPASGAIPIIQFNLPPADSLPRVLVFIDSDRDGLADADEQRLGNVQVSLLNRGCGQVGSVLETKATLSDGTVTFAAPPVSNLNLLPQAVAPPGGGYVCAAIASGLPNNLIATSNSGVNVPVATGEMALLPVQPVSALLVRFFWDADGDTVQDDGEPAIGGGSVSVNGNTRIIPSNGPYLTNFLLLPGSYPLQVTAPYGFTPAVTMPLTVVLNPNASQTVAIPFRAQSGITGLINGGASSLVSGLTVTLENVNTSQVWQTTSSAPGRNNPLAGRFAFTNLPSGTYRLRLPSPPPGYMTTSEPLITLLANSATTQNLALTAVAHVSGQVFLDANSDGQRQSGDVGSNAFSVQLLSMGGQVLQTTTPAPDGAFILEGLSANTQYALRVVSPNSNWFTTASPGVFTIGAQTVAVQLGVGYAPPPTGNNQSGLWGMVYYLQDGVQIPIANARLVYEDNNGAPLGEQHSGASGGYGLMTPAQGGQMRVVDVPGFANSGWITWEKETIGCGNCVLVGGVYLVVRNIKLNPTPPLLNTPDSMAATLATVSWSAFRDDNGSGMQDVGEPGLPGVSLTAGAITSQANGSGLGSLLLDDGLHTLTISPPSGYVVVGAVERLLSIQGADVTLPPIPLRPTALTVVSAFLDLDGNDRQGLGEAGVGGVVVNLNSANGVTAPDGRFLFNNLADGVYTLTVVPPAGFVTPAASSVTLNQGGVVAVPLRVKGVVTALLYEDWDGDGLRAADEIGFRWPYTLTLQSNAITQQTVTAAGLGEFLGVTSGSYALTSLETAVAGTTIVLPANGGAGAGLTIVPAGVVRGTAWLDANGDGLRQANELPLAGIAVTLAGQTRVTDENGRYTFTGIAVGSYEITAVLPSGLTAEMGPVVVGAGRGTAVGIASRTGYAVFLPMIVR